MTREKHIELLKNHIEGFQAKHPFMSRIEREYLEAVIAGHNALVEQEERSKGCEYCQMFDDPCGVPMIASEEDDCDRGIYLYNGYLCANGGSFCDAKVKFCPMCGRELEVEG